MTELEKRIRGYYAQERLINVTSSMDDELLDAINPEAIQYSLSHRASQRLIAMCEVLRASDFKYKEWKEWYDASKSNDTISDFKVKDFINTYGTTTIRIENGELYMLPNIANFYKAMLVAELSMKDSNRKKQFLSDYSRYLCLDEILQFFKYAEKDKATPMILAFVTAFKTIFQQLYYAQNIKNISIENELLQMLSPERFRTSSLTKEDFEGRNPFESDYFRVITAPPVRRLQDKTQIFPQEKSDFVRRRLTHSMEVAAIGRQLGLMVEEILMDLGYLFSDQKYAKEYSHSLGAILEAAGLVHDIGNPPFGHFGEDTIQRYFEELIDRSKLEKKIEAAQLKLEGRQDVTNKQKSVALSVTKILLKEQFEQGLVAEAFMKLSLEQRLDFTHFDGNVQGLRILRHLGLSNDHDSFNLTMPTMATIIKYPFPSKHDVIPNNHSSEKYGYYQAEKEAYEEICKTLHLRGGKRHPLAYLLEAADDIVNVTSDVEDGYKMGIIGLEDIELKIKKLRLKNLHFKTIREYNKKQALNGKCSADVSDELLVKEFRIRAVHELMKEAVDVFIKNIPYFIKDSYDPQDGSKQRQMRNKILGNELLKDSKLRQALSDLQIMTYRDTYVLKSELLGEHVITTMLDKFIGCMFSKAIKEKVVNGKKRYYINPKTAEGKLYALISSNYKRAFDCEENEIPAKPYHRFLLAVDHVSGMTDSYIVDLYNELTNRKR